MERWGFRNPYGIGIDPSDASRLFVSNNGADTREAMIGGTLQIVGSRPVDEDFDDLFSISVGGDEEFFGWPDFFHDSDDGEVLPVTDEEFCEELEGFGCPRFVFDADFGDSLDVERAFAQLGYHTSANKFGFSTSPLFMSVGDISVAETGSLIPGTGAEELAGYKAVRVDTETGKTKDFISHIRDTADVIFDPLGMNKPIDVKFHDGVMHVVDFGAFAPSMGINNGSSGKLWVVWHQGLQK